MLDCSVTVALCAVLGVTLFYLTALRHWTFFSARGIPFVRGLPVLGTNYRVLLGRESLFPAIERIYQRFAARNAPVVGLFDVGGVPQFLLRDPALIKQLTVKAFDAFANHRIQVDAAVDPLASRNLFFAKDAHWREMRSVLSPAYTGAKMRAMLPLVVRCGRDFVEHLPSAGGVLEMKDTFSRYAGDTIASCAFGLEVNSLADPRNEFFRTGASLTEGTTAFLLKFLGYSTVPRVMRALGVRLVKPADERYFRDVVRQTIEHRRQSNVVRNDMIDLLLQARTELRAEGKELSETDFVAQCMIFFIAGFDTTSALMCFMAHELAVNTGIQERLCVEVDELRGALAGQPLDYEHLTQRLPYMDAVIAETLRKWPPVGLIDRVCNRALTVELSDGRELRFDVGDGFVIPVYALHRDPIYWPMPEHFDPERFASKERIQAQVSGSYVPFGMGPRVCIGQRFALMETKSLFYHVLSEFRFEVCERTQQPLRLGSGVTAAPERGIWVRLERRR